MSSHPANRTHARPVTPASSCAGCLREGIVALDQRTHSGADYTNASGSKPLAGIRFECARCGAMWTTSRAQALEHGRFLQRINQHQNRDN